MFDQIFVSPQVKRSVLISNKHIICSMVYSSCQRTKDLNLEASWSHSLVPILCPKMYFFQY